MVVPMVGGGNNDGINVRAGEDLAVIAGGEKLGAIHFLRPGQPAVVQIADRHQLNPVYLGGRIDVVEAHDAGANAGYPDFIVGGYWLFRLQQQMLLLGSSAHRQGAAGHQGGGSA